MYGCLCYLDLIRVRGGVTLQAVEADVTVVAVGIDSSFEGENGDYRAFNGIGLPGAQAELVATVAAAAKAPIVVVVTGSSVDLAAIKASLRLAFLTGAVRLIYCF